MSRTVPQDRPIWPPLPPESERGSEGGTEPAHPAGEPQPVETPETERVRAAEDFEGFGSFPG